MGYQDRGYYRPRGTGGFSFFPPVIKWLLILNGAVFFIQLLTQSISVGGVPLYNAYIINYFGLQPLGPSYGTFFPWQLITYQFMHGGFTHILFNMFFLWMFGMELEQMWGSRKFLFVYLLSGIVAGLFQLLVAPLFSGGVGPTIGASGAVFGILVAFGMFFPDRYIYLYFLIPVKAKYLIAFLVIIEFMSVGDQSFVAHLAHIGGALTGVIFVLLDRQYNFNVDKLFDIFKSSSSSSGGYNRPKTERKFRRPFQSREDVEDAEFYDINSSTGSGSKKEDVSQDEIDRILDKISESGYQNLTEREKKILFEASKKN